MSGSRDPWISVAESRAIYERLRGPKRIKIFDGLGHQDFLRPRFQEWTSAVGSFVGTLPPPEARP